MGEKSVFPMPLANLRTDSHQTRVCYVTRPPAHFEPDQNRVDPQVRYFRKLGFFQKSNLTIVFYFGMTNNLLQSEFSHHPWFGSYEQKSKPKKNPQNIKSTTEREPSAPSQPK